MTLENIIESIKLLTVKVKTDKESGTGVLFLQDGKAYVLTVYHCIYGKGTEPHNVENENISLTFDSKIFEPIINPLDFKGYNENIVLLEVDINNLQIDFIPSLLLLDRAFLDKSYHLRGYSKGLSHDHPFEAKCKDKALDKITFSIRVDGLTEDTSGNDIIDSVAGLSGSGVFFSENNQLYLIGLLNSLPTDGGLFNIGYGTKLVDLYSSNIKFSELYTIDEIVHKLKEIDKEISEEACRRFEDDNTFEYNNINRKHSNIYNTKEVFIKNIEGIKNYLQGQNSVNEMKVLDNNFENDLIKFISDTLSLIKPSISEYIDSKKEGRENLKLIRKETIEAIKDELNLIQKDIYLSNKLREYIVIGWLLNCNIDFIVEKDS